MMFFVGLKGKGLRDIKGAKGVVKGYKAKMRYSSV
jgi:hypothetical protein